MYSFSFQDKLFFFIYQMPVCKSLFKNTPFLPAIYLLTADMFVHDVDDDPTLYSWKALTNGRTQSQNAREKKKSASMFLTSSSIWYWSILPDEEVLSINKTSSWPPSRDKAICQIWGNIQLRTRLWVGDIVDSCLCFKRIAQVDMSSQRMDGCAKLPQV